MKLNILGYTLTAQRTLLTPEQVELKKMVDSERESLINITAQDNQILFLENMLEAYTLHQMEDKMEQTKSSLEAARNTLLQWEVQLVTIEEWYNERE